MTNEINAESFGQEMWGKVETMSWKDSMREDTKKRRVDDNRGRPFIIGGESHSLWICRQP